MPSSECPSIWGVVEAQSAFGTRVSLDTIMGREPEMKLTKYERLQIFFERLKNHAPAASESEARQILAILLEQVEDEYSGVPAEPESPERMYPPLDDNRVPISQSPEIVRYRSKGHRTFIRGDGAILIADLKWNVIFWKAGSSGCKFGLSELPGR